MKLEKSTPWLLALLIAVVAVGQTLILIELHRTRALDVRTQRKLEKFRRQKPRRKPC